jgi:uncharacterized integral membrane protein (TIGR00697 family)
MIRKLKQEMNQKQYKYLEIIICLLVAIMVIDISTAGKIIQIGIFTVSVTILYFPFIFIVGDILTEVYGYKQGRRATWILVFVQILTAIIYQIMAVLPSAHGVKGNEVYSFVFGQVPRNVLGALIGVLVGSFVNDYTLAKMKIFTRGRYLWTRTIGSTITGQLVDTALFYTIALSKLIPTHLLLQSILSGWILKTAIEAVMTPITYVVINKLKQIENEDYYDTDTDFSPLIFQLKSIK